MKERSRRWLEAANILGRDATAKVLCPACQSAALTVTDTTAGDAFERWMQCPACGALNTLMKRIPALRDDVRPTVAERIAALIDDSVVMRSDDINAEALANLRTITLSIEEAATVSTSDVAEFAHRIASSRRRWLIAHGGGAMTMYWWHDEQAGQLRFSLVSANHRRLPFACAVVPAEDFDAIASAWLASRYLSGIPASEFAEAPSEGDAREPDRELVVWSVTVP